MPIPSVEEQIQALIEEEVTRAMTPYRALGLPPAALEEMESVLRFGLTTHPTAQALLHRLVEEEPVLLKSGTLCKGDLEGAGKGKEA